MNAPTSTSKPLLGAGLLTALAASLCCITPLLALVGGLGASASAFSWLEPFRPYLMALTVGVLGFAWYQKLKPAPAGEGYVLLQKTLERLTGKSFETLAREEVFRPLGMKHSSFVWQEKFTANAASGHDGQSQPVAISHFPAAYGAFSLFSTAADYSRFLQALMTGRGLKPATALLLRTPANDAQRCGQPATATDPFIAWACGVGLATTSRGLAQWQWGDNGNFKGFYMTLPGTQQSLVFLTNSANGPKMADDLLPLFFGPGEYRALQWLAE